MASSNAIIVHTSKGERWVYDEHENMIGAIYHTEIRDGIGGPVLRKAWTGMNWDTGQGTGEHEHPHGAARELLSLRRNQG